MTLSTRCILWDGPGKVSLQQRFVPEPAAGQALLEILTNGLCSTDYAIVRGEVAGAWLGMVKNPRPQAARADRTSF
jgi:D-arabinose 1-dehydrogenase-like Zn-dependent alcohol dehydrogenase